jgi:hypothetical protein
MALHIDPGGGRAVSDALEAMVGISLREKRRRACRVLVNLC